jgi:mannosidase alpha-like ER degradation enhancer 3
MPLSCKGRYRNSEASRGDIDDVLGNFSLTLIDSLDTLAVFGKFDQFETAVMNVIENTDFDRDLVVSVFELNIRVVGGLIGAHVSINYIKEKYEKNKHFKWYTDELLRKAKELAYRLLPAFDTKSGLPTPRINLKYGITNELKISEREKYTCTACAGTLILEFAALSRLTGDHVFESKARQILDYIWDKRNRASGLVGTILNVHNGDWINKEASIGAGIDSYYEYLFKGYVLLGDNELLHRFNHHYESIMKYMSNRNGLIMQTVHMHMPHKQARTHMDSLLAFWPGLQAFKGDIKEAIKMHEQLYKVVKKYKFLPEAFLSDGSVYWANHPLRPEFLESTYYLYRATNDPYYLEIGKEIIDYLETYSRVKCGYAAIANVRTAEHEDRSDSFFYAETFKYLYLLFEEPGRVKIDVDDFLFSTEAHLLPLDLINMNTKQNRTRVDKKKIKKMTCTSIKSLFANNLTISKFRESVSSQQQQHAPSSCSVSVFDNVDISLTSNADGTLKLKAANFVSGNLQHLEILRMMGR